LLLLLFLLPSLVLAAPSGAPDRENPDHLIGAAGLDYLLPIRSPGLTLGTVEARSLDITFSRPLFLIGSDHRSRR